MLQFAKPCLATAVALLFLLLVPSAESLSVSPLRNHRISMTTTSNMLAATCHPTTADTFCGNKVLLTGASGGLGRSFALQLAHAKAHTIVLSGRNEASLQSVAEECKTICADIVTHIITCDLSDKASVAALTKAALEACHGRIDVLINNGGVSSRSRFIDTDLSVDERVMQINFFAGAALAKGVVPGMVERGYGKIIWISSVQGLCK